MYKLCSQLYLWGNLISVKDVVCRNISSEKVLKAVLNVPVSKMKQRILHKNRNGVFASSWQYLSQAVNRIDEIFILCDIE